LSTHTIDVLYEYKFTTLEGDYFVLTADLSIDFEFLPGGGNGFDEPRYGGSVGFIKADMQMGRRSWVPAPKYLQE
jgi:hypothetical protein